MAATRVPASRKREPDLSHRKFDIIGIATLALALVTLVSLMLSGTGLLGEAIGGGFRALFGRGSWIVPIFLALLGGGFIAGKRKLEVTHLGIGLSLIFLSILGMLARSRNGDFFDFEVISGSGGYVGAILGWTFESLLGRAMFIGLAALVFIGLVLCVNVPLRHTLARAKSAASELKERKLPVVSEARPRVRAVVAAEIEEEEETAPVIEPRRKAKPLVRESIPMAADAPVPADGYQLPPLSLLVDPQVRPKRSAQEMQRNIDTLESTLEEFGIDSNVVEVATGPTVTRYEISLGPGIRVARIAALADNIAMNLAASHVRVEAPIPGKSAIGVEVPNGASTMVTLREVLDTKEFSNHPSKLFIGLGQDVSGVNKYADLTRMPHLLIGGATNSGKSIGLASVIMGILMRCTPKDCKFVMIDPKRVELTLFDGIPHLLCPVIKDVKEAPGVLRAVWREMDRRYDVLSENGMRNIDTWNAQASFQDRMPYIGVVIEELADLMIQAAAEVETSIVRLAQLARAVGIHLVIATQRPSVDVITGTIKANIPSRLAFSVSSQIDSRTILDSKGAEDLIGRGDMLFQPIDASKPVRIQGCYVAEKEIEAVCNFWRAQEKPSYVLQPIAEAASGHDRGMDDDEMDPLWEETVRWVVDRGQASTSMLQRRFSIGFQRASRLLDLMEERQIVGPRDGPRPREVLVDAIELEALFGTNMVPVNAGIRSDLLDEDLD
ncbi:MAG: DNA translocase FtsK [Fimbriimonadaceae bacterium]